MQTTSDLYKELLANGARKEVRVEVAGQIYDENNICGLSTLASLFVNDFLSVGGAVSRQIDLVLKNYGDIPKMAKITPSYRLVLGEQASEWIQKGVFYIDTRQPDKLSNTLSIHGFDDMLKSSVIWEPSQDLVFPMTFRAAAQIIANLMGVELDNPEDIDDTYQVVDYPANDYTQRNVLQFIAAAHAANFVMTDLGKLRMVGINDLPVETSSLVTERGSAILIGGVRIAVGSTEENNLTGEGSKVFVGGMVASTGAPPAFDPITKVVVKVDEENAYFAGDETGRTLEVTCPYGTQEITDNILTKVSGYVYRPFTAEDALVDQAIELGDGITVDGVYTILAKQEIVFDSLMAGMVAAPGQEEIESEYPYQTKEQQIELRLARTRSLIEKTADEIRLLVEQEVGELGDRYTELAVTVDGVIVTTSNADGTKTITLKDGIVTSDAIMAGVEIRSPTIMGGVFYAVGENSYLQMTPTGLEAYVDDSKKPKMVLENDTSEEIVRFILGAGTTTSGDYGRMFVWKDATGGGVHYVGGDSGEAYFGQRVGFEFGDDGVISFFGNLAIDGLLSLEQGGVNYGYIGTSVESSVGGYGVTLLDPTETNGFWAFTSGAKIQASELNQVIATTPTVTSNGGVTVVAQGENFYFNDEYFCPAHTPTLGTSNLRWGQIYSTNSAISTSDREKKNSVVYDMDERFDTLWSLLKPCTGKFNDGTSDRTHMFLISQDVETAIEQAGLTSRDFAAFIKSPKMDENFNIIDGYDYGLRYEEFIPLCIRQIQKLQARVAELEEKTA